MSLYQKTHRGFCRKNYTKREKFKWLKISGIFIIDSLFNFFITIKKVINSKIFKALFFLGKIFLLLLFRLLVLPSYRLLLKSTWELKKIFAHTPNKFFFLLSNRYVSHSVAVLMIVLALIQNINTYRIRAEDFGKNSMFANLYIGELYEEDITEEEVMVEKMEKTSPKQPEELSPALKSQIGLGEKETPTQHTSLTEEGSAIIKPQIPETIDTPKPRETIIEYVVQENDTVFAIAEEFNITVDTILWANQLTSRSIIKPGDKLKILPVTGLEHKVGQNETLNAIAVKYKVPVEDILEINKLSVNTTLQIGQSLIIPDGKPLYVPTPKRQRYLATTPRYGASIDDGIGLFWPTICRRITQYFIGWRHTGIDIACNLGAYIYAAEDGVVEKANWNAGGYGNLVIIRHTNGLKTLYGHLRAGGILVSPGQYVKKGQVIGLMGSTGRSTGPHLHFEVLKNGSRINPFTRL